MTQRDRQVLLYLFGGLGAVAVLAFLVFQWFWKPLQENNRSITRLEKEIDDKDKLVFTILRDRKKLELWRNQGLPSNPNKAASEYHKFLQKLFKDSGLKVDEIQGPPPDVKPPSAKDKDKGSSHITLAFVVRAKGTLASVVTMFEKFQATPLLHRVKSFTVDKAEASSSKQSGGLLALHMTFETLIVNRLEKAQANVLSPNERQVVYHALGTLQGVPGGLALVPWQYTLLKEKPQRRYADIAKKNVFTGAPPPPPPLPPQPKPEPEKKDAEIPDDVDVRDYIRLMYTTQTESEDGKVKENALMRNFLADIHSVFGYIKLNPDPKSGFSFFQIFNDSGRKVLIKGKVLRIEPRDVYFQVKGDVYCIHIGQTMAEAMEKPLAEDVVEFLELTPVPYTPTEEDKAGKNKSKKR